MGLARGLAGAGTTNRGSCGGGLGRSWPFQPQLLEGLGEDSDELGVQSVLRIDWLVLWQGDGILRVFGLLLYI